jgi:hypothetical protein
MKLNGALQLLVYVDDENLLGDIVNKINKKHKAIIEASKDLGLEVNAWKTKYMLLSHRQN